MKRFEDKVAIVTGAAGGIGSATAHRLAAEGAAVAIVDLDADAAANVAAAIATRGGRAIAVAGDVADESSVEAVFAGTVEAFGGVDVLHNNAAALSAEVVGRDTEVLAIDRELFDATMSVNLLGAIYMCKHAIPRMIERGGGAIVNTSSISAFSAAHGFPVYSASKAGVSSLTQSVATQYGKQGVRCNAVAPGLTLSPRMRANFDPKQLEGLAAEVLTTRLGEPKDIAGLVAFLASDDAAYVTAQVIAADGGVTAYYA
ncbi:MAG: glucose 1-dehydrogenase [Actinobacteria bacterium]|nr:glucose 1-dehydrogenase [Actinomycetota bacterium]